MLVSTVPLTDLTPAQPAAIDGRYIVQWEKDQVEDAGLLKIDLLALGALSQMQQAVRLAAVRPAGSRISAVLIIGIRRCSPT